MTDATQEVNVSKTDLGIADSISLDQFTRTLASQMFENDNNVAHLEVILNGTDATVPPTLTFMVMLTHINGTPVEEGDTASG